MSNWNFTTALITGGGSGIGLKTAETFIQRGKKVILAGRTEDKLKKACEELGDSAQYVVVELSDIAGLEKFAKDLISKFPDLDCLVNNAGVMLIDDYTKDDTERLLYSTQYHIDTNVTAVLQLTHHLLPHLLSKPHSAVMNTSSGIAFVPYKPHPMYSGTKAFIHAWTMCLRYQLEGKSSLRVIEIAPPLVETPLFRDFPNQDAQKVGTSIAISQDDFIQQWVQDMDAGLNEPSAASARQRRDAWHTGLDGFCKMMNERE